MREGFPDRRPAAVFRRHRRILVQDPFDARLFPLVIGTAGILLTLVIALEQVHRQRAGAADAVDERDPAARVGWPRFATALLSAPVFGLAFWLLGFVVASLAAMLLMPALMGS